VRKGAKECVSTFKTRKSKRGKGRQTVGRNHSESKQLAVPGGGGEVTRLAEER
jgi:hypothetical protein